MNGVRRVNISFGLTQSTANQSIQDVSICWHIDSKIIDEDDYNVG